MKIAAIDFETANQSPASVCSVGIAVYEDGCVENAYYSLIRPEANVSYFSPHNIMIHGIHPEEVEDAPDFPAVFQEMMEVMDGALVCAHNAMFDMNCLKASCRNCGIPVPSLRYFDTLALSRRLFPGLPHHRLNDMCEYLNVELDHHHAGSDAMGCLMIVVQSMNLSGIYDVEEFLRTTGIKIHSL
ncbi:MAG: 3'-5' exonuclease [Solobacterium sp.]|nr:3'-5' exonuclease [Solobacterium sp.]